MTEEWQTILPLLQTEHANGHPQNKCFGIIGQVMILLPFSKKYTSKGITIIDWGYTLQFKILRCATIDRDT
jgi:hypothetical protein